MVIFKIIVIFSLCLSLIDCKINVVSDDELIEHIRNDERVVVLYMKKNCDESEKYESVVENLKPDIEEHLNAKVVKAVNSPMAALFSPTKEPAIVYYRQGLPLLYHGPLSEEAIISNFYDNPDPLVRELSDENFEHLTQVATGATTGDWFIFFYTTNCASCQRLHASWEAVAAALNRRMNIARMNIQYQGKLTGKRFDINSTPHFILFRLGKFYRYKSDDYTPGSLINFAMSLYKTDAKPENAPPEYSEPLHHKIMELFKQTLEQPYTMSVLGIFFFIIAIGAVMSKFRTPPKPKQDKNKKKK